MPAQFPHGLLHLLTERQRAFVRAFYGIGEPKLKIPNMRWKFECSTANIYEVLHAACRAAGLEKRIGRVHTQLRISRVVVLGRRQVVISAEEALELLAQYPEAVSASAAGHIRSWAAAAGDKQSMEAWCRMRPKMLLAFVAAAVRRLALVAERTPSTACPVCHQPRPLQKARDVSELLSGGGDDGTSGDDGGSPALP